MSTLPRRRFLASASVAATPLLGASAATAAHTTPAPASQAAPNNAWHVLAVAPLSRKLPALASDYRRGVELGLAQHPGVNLQLHWVGADAIPSKAAKTIAAELEHLPQLHGVMGWLPPELERRVAVMTEERGLPLWVSDTGADWRVHSERPSATAFHSLELCAHAEQLARQVFQQQGPRAMLAVGWLESGYDFVVAFQEAYRALGGRIVGRHLGGPVPQAQEFDGLRSELFRQQPDSVVAFYSGVQAQRFAQWWQAHAQGQGGWGLAPDLLTRAAQAQWHPPFTQALHSPSPAALLGVQAGLGIGASLFGHSSRSSSQLLRQAWLQSVPAEPMGKPSNAVVPPPLSSGWLNGYLQT